MFIILISIMISTLCLNYVLHLQLDGKEFEHRTSDIYERKSKSPLLQQKHCAITKTSNHIKARFDNSKRARQYHENIKIATTIVELDLSISRDISGTSRIPLVTLDPSRSQVFLTATKIKKSNALPFEVTRFRIRHFF